MAQGASGKAIIALVLGILGIVSCFPCGIAAIFVANSELRDIAAGISSPEGEGMAKAGKVLGWISLGLAVVGFLGLLCMGSFLSLRSAGAALP
jgi:hypothetical protein